jgi:hypothetical protein
LAERAIELGADHVLHRGAGVIDAGRRLLALRRAQLSTYYAKHTQYVPAFRY